MSRSHDEIWHAAESMQVASRIYDNMGGMSRKVLLDKSFLQSES